MKSRLFVIFGILLSPFIFFCLFNPRKSLETQIFKIANEFKVIPKDNFSREWNETIHKYLTFPLDTHYGSHAIVLLAAAIATKSGPILELGMGSTSTVLLHRLAIDQKRFLLSADSNLRWVSYFRSHLGNDSLHKIKYVEVNTEMGVEWAKADFGDSHNWSIVFIDHRPGPRRQFDLMLYAQRSTLVILHDTEQTSLYKYEEGLSAYHDKYRFTRLPTYTDVLSVNSEALIKKIRFLLESIPDHYFPKLNLTKTS
jgi:hypothetical protein